MFAWKHFVLSLIFIYFSCSALVITECVCFVRVCEGRKIVIQNTNGVWARRSTLGGLLGVRGAASSSHVGLQET